MSAAKTKATLSRQWELLQILPRQGDGITISELHQQLEHHGFKVSRRTVERDLEALSLPFPIYCDDEQNISRWRWMDHKKNELPGMSVAEAMMLQLVEGTLKTMLPDTLLQGLASRFAQAKGKILALEDSNSHSKLADKIAVVAPSLPLTPPTVPAVFYQAVQMALTHKKQLFATYTAMQNQQHKTYLLNPLGLVQRGHVTYLVATVAEYADVRLFALHRFISLSLLESVLSSPANFSLASYIKNGAMQFGSGEQIQLKARISDYLARILLEAPLAADMTLQKAEDDWYLLNATVFDGWQLQWWILSHSRAIEVLAPQSLRLLIIEKVKDTAALYAE